MPQDRNPLRPIGDPLSHCHHQWPVAKIIAIADIPRTRNGKIAELAVGHVIHGRTVGNRDALANPEALDLYRNLEELKF